MVFGVWRKVCLTFACPSSEGFGGTKSSPFWGFEIKLLSLRVVCLAVRIFTNQTRNPAFQNPDGRTGLGCDTQSVAQVYLVCHDHRHWYGFVVSITYSM